MLTRIQKKAYELLMSGENVFLTGEAGTGKSYLLQKFISDVKSKGKNVLVCAPSGIAAINVGGITLHRAFKAPIKPLVEPVLDTTRVVEEADLVIIDEISMCRIDLFDYVIQSLIIAENHSNRHKQLIVVGDFLQLPPVITDRDRVILETHYGNVGHGYAFQSFYWGLLDFKYITLNKIVRQSNPTFIKALNAARIGDLSCLEYFDKHTSKAPFKNGINLCSTNRQAENTNSLELQKIKKKKYQFRAIVEGEIKDNDKPTLDCLELKVGARVMMLTNEQGGLWQNGSLGTIIHIDDYYDYIEIKLDSSNSASIKVERYKWSVEDYVVSVIGGKNVIEKSEIGSFTQYPLKLAYAITIHKSQGKTFDAVNLYPNTFAPGQLYVALSRVRSADTLHLKQSIQPDYLKVSHEVIDFYNSMRGGKYENN